MSTVKILPVLSVFIVVLGLTGCAKKLPESDDSVVLEPKTSSSQDRPSIDYSNDPIPPATLEVADTHLRLVRMMEGGACKNQKEGVKGVFLVYSDPDQVTQIRKQKGDAVFSVFEQEIQDLSLDALNHAVQAIEFTIDPFALDLDDAQEKVFIRLAKAFQNEIANNIQQFQEKYHLSIAVIPFRRTFEFYLGECNLSQID
ncbi:MAG: hypothetical protein K0U68_12520 [Gammaproteobacteria bacterium]|nr:hypothetical protein [Gammaproteobacteria bacterium]